MSRIVPIPTTRVGNFFIRQRIVSQVETDQLDLFRLQNQISTGRRIILPSEDAPAALRAINLQRTIHRKGQVATNLTGSQSVLAGADSALGNVSDTLTKIKAAAIGVADTVSSDEARLAVVQQIDQALALLVNTGNSDYSGRFLFSGSRTDTLPFDYNGAFVEYFGNEKNLRNYVDLGQLFETNVPGSEVFGGLSGEVRGNVDLNPHLSTDTFLSSLNGGEGLGSNAAITISVANGITTTSIIDLSTAATIEDVVRLIEANPPAGSNITVDVNAQNGLTVQTDVGTVRITEVAAGRTAKELGIFTPTSFPPSATVTGTDLNPAVLKTTPLSDLLGTKAQGRLVSANPNNDIILTANSNGTALNGVTVQFVAGAVAGSEVANLVGNTLTVTIEPGQSSANQVVAAIIADGNFTAQADHRDAISSTQAGSGTVTTINFGVVTSGGSGEDLDVASGLILNNGGDSVTLDISTSVTVEDLLNQIRTADVGFLAKINATANGIDVRSVLSGADFTIGENGGTTATQLGIRSYTGATNLADFNRGIGVPTNDILGALDQTQLDNLEIVARDGTVLAVNTAGSATLQEVVNRINAAPGNFAGTTAVTASLTKDGNGISLLDSSTATTGPLTVQTVVGNVAAEYLGFVPSGQTQITSMVDDGFGNYILPGNDVVKNDVLVEARDGTQFWIDLTDAITAQDVIDRVNASAVDAGVAVTAQLATTGNGIELVDASVGGGTLNVQAVEGSEAAEFLGFIPNGPVTLDGGGNQVLVSEDRHTLEVDSVFNTMIRLRQALVDNDIIEIGRATQRIDVDQNRANFARAEVGSRLQSLELINTRLEDENVQLRSALSNEIDVDLVEAISSMTARQQSLQASLQTASMILNLSILDFL